MRRIIWKISKVLILICLIVLVLILIGYKQVNYLNSYNITTSTLFFSNKKWIEIPVKLNEFDSYGLFDTGANICAIDKSAVGKFNIYQLPFNLIQVNKNSWHPLCIVESLEIGGFVFKNVLAVVLDLKGENKVFRCNQSDIVIGTSIINKLCWNFNFNQNALSISKNSCFEDEMKLYNSISYKGLNLFKVGVTINDQIHNLLIDFGHTSSIVLPLKFADLAGGIKYKSSDKHDVFGNYYEEGMQSFSDIVIGVDTIRKVKVDYTSKLNNVLGLGFFRDYKNLIINPFKRVIYFGERKKRNEEFLFYGFGFDFGIENNNLIITSVFESSPANKTGLRYGDTIIEINGEKTSQYILGLDFCIFYQKRDSILSQQMIDLKVVRKDTFNITVVKDYY
jgi:hypothetical protein